MGKQFNSLTEPEQAQIRNLARTHIHKSVKKWPRDAYDAFCERLAQPDGQQYMQYYMLPENEHPRYEEWKAECKRQIKEHGYGFISDRMELLHDARASDEVNASLQLSARTAHDYGKAKNSGLAEKIEASIKLELDRMIRDKNMTVGEYITSLEQQAYRDTIKKPFVEAVATADKIAEKVSSRTWLEWVSQGYNLPGGLPPAI